MSKLVIVESPTKAKTISKFLGREYKVLSSYGHIRDLPQSDLGVDIEHGYEPKYVIPPTSKKHVKALKDAAKESEDVLFATDEDREGEAISWHLADVLGIDPDKVKRIVFHEITKGAIEKALEHPRALDQHLVDAQQARRILDRLYGYEISPILWRKVAPKLSAGRVQSVATRLIVERERERMHFKKAGYADILGRFAKDGSEFPARLTEVDGTRIATGKDFDPATGALSSASRNVVLLDSARAESLAKEWGTSTWSVSDVEQKPVTSRPAPPFTTSTLQQEAARKLNVSAKEAMRTAQTLYERGFITYMRTDSTFLSDQALSASREAVTRHFGKNFLPDAAVEYKTKVRNAQEAHEAIRPAGETFADPASIKDELNPMEHALYDLVWKRTLASQMLPARLLQTSVRLTNGPATFAASGRVVEFAGYMQVYLEGTDEESENAEEQVLPPLEKGERVACQGLAPETHETKPPARYTEASLVKFLEQNGIGRPSTFASIISTILTREYVRKDGKALVPTWKAFAVTQLLEQNFSHLVDTNFTAEMEDGLDTISVGEREMVPFLNAFYLGGGKVRGLKELLSQDIDARAAATVPIGEKDGVPVNVRVGRYGPFIEFDTATANVPEDMAPDSLSVDMAIEMVAEQAKGPTALGTDPASGKPVYVLTGRYGPYVQLGDREPDEPADTGGVPLEDRGEVPLEDRGGVPAPRQEKAKAKAKKSRKKRANKPKMKSLLPGMSVESMTLETALQLLSLPRDLGVWEKTGQPIMADLGRFGPYLKSGEESRSIPKDKQLLELTLEEAVEILNRPKRGRGRGSKTVLKELGEDPETKKPVQILDGRYGPYVTSGKTNASLPKGTDPQSVTMEQALALLAEKRP